MKGAGGTVFLILIALAAALAGCERVADMEEVPAQTFATLPEVLGRDIGSLTGQVFFPSEYSQRSVTIRLDENTFVTHPDGRFLVTRIPTGRHRFSLQVQGFEPISRDVSILPDRTALLGELRLVLARGSVLGRLVFLDGASAAKLPLRLEPAGGQTISDSDGIFQFVGVPGGQHQLLIEDRRYYIKSLTVQLEPDETLNLGIVNVFRRAGVEKAALSLGSPRAR
jgi:hypothetical protein